MPEEVNSSAALKSRKTAEFIPVSWEEGGCNEACHSAVQNMFPQTSLLFAFRKIAFVNGSLQSSPFTYLKHSHAAGQSSVLSPLTL